MKKWKKTNRNEYIYWKFEKVTMKKSLFKSRNEIKWEISEADIEKLQLRYKKGYGKKKKLNTGKK